MRSNTPEYDRQYYAKRRTALRAKRRKHYRAVHSKTPEVWRKYVRERRQRLKAWIASLKQGKPCVDCKTIYPPCVMDWDHIRGVKSFTVCQAWTRGQSKATILKEIEKCELRCANCH